MDFNIRQGQLLTLTFEGKAFEVIVIDPNGLGKGQPTVGFGFRMMQKHGGLPEQTLSNWLTKESGFEGDPNNEVLELKPPSGNRFRATQISGADNNQYVALEVSDWVALASDVLKKPGKVSKATQHKLIDFLIWFAVKGFYAEAYTTLKGAYTAKDSRATTKWLEMRQAGKVERKSYTDLLQAQGCQSPDYAHWTDHVYLGLFGMRAKNMREVWALIDGNEVIARNHIPEAQGLEAVRYCEDMVVRLFIDDLEQAHDDAISYSRRKFIGSATTN